MLFILNILYVSSIYPVSWPDMRSFHLCFLFLSTGFLFSTQNHAQTTVKKNDNGWQLLVDDKLFEIKGVTFGYEKDVENYDTYFKDLQFLGVNTIRTWATGKNTKALLDAAHKHGIKIMMGIWMRHGRPGMEDDDRFNYLKDTKGMEAMYSNAIDVVAAYKGHPAVLTWGIGNEVYLNTATDAEKEAYSILLERICSKIKTIDPNHPITSVEAWTFGLDWWEKHVPSLDIYGLNSYGAGAGLLTEELEERNIDKPYIITEFGVTGEWDIQQERHGIKVEPNDQQKYNAIAMGYHDWIRPRPACLGVYVFHYSNGDDHMAPWLFTHYKGKYRPQYWAIREAYTGEKSVNNVPVINSFELPDEITKSGTWVPVILEASDIEKDSLTYNFVYNQRTGSRKRRDQLPPLQHRRNSTNGFEIEMPQEHGTIKVYATVSDSYGNVGIASTAMRVEDKKAKKRKYQVPKAALPFYVYKDGDDEVPYAPSGYMGYYQAINVDLNNTEQVHSGKSAIKISYNINHNWYGVGFMDPANDWGNILGGYDISGAETFSFWAKSSVANKKVTIGFGLIDKDKPYPDTAKRSVELFLTRNWKKYTIKTKRLDLSCIRTGLVIFAGGDGAEHEIYIDEVVFE